MWAPLESQRRWIERAGIELGTGGLMAARTGRSARLEGATTVLLVTDADDLRVLARVVLADRRRRTGPPGRPAGSVRRVGPPGRSAGSVHWIAPPGRSTGSLRRNLPAARHLGCRRPLPRRGRPVRPGLPPHTVAAGGPPRAGVRFRPQPASGPRPPGHETVFVVRRDGRLQSAIGNGPPTARDDGTLVPLGHEPDGS
ncbi:hypothetical protein ACFXC9_00585 [Streptomyces naganishii]|uniref:hypothetical protein n=1 Tax=Streptomyces naganishii TaxID=285447 RepID=UPI0036C8FE78